MTALDFINTDGLQQKRRAPLVEVTGNARSKRFRPAPTRVRNSPTNTPQGPPPEIAPSPLEQNIRIHHSTPTRHQSFSRSTRPGFEQRISQTISAPSVREIRPPVGTTSTISYPSAYIQDTIVVPVLQYGGMRENECEFCGAFYWPEERTRNGPGRYGKFTGCCRSDTVRLDPFPPLPHTMKELLRGTTPESKNFCANIRQYNAAFAFTSANYQTTDRGATGGGHKVFQIMGELYHLMGPLEKTGPDDARYAQMYFYDPQVANNARLRRQPNQNLQGDILMDIHTILTGECRNPFIGVYRTAHEILQTARQIGTNLTLGINPDIQLIIQDNADIRRENLPIADEVAVLIYEGSERKPQDLILHYRDQSGHQSGTRRIYPTSPHYHALHYVLLFPTGHIGWSPDLTIHNPDGERQRDRLTMKMYAAFHLYPRRTTLYVPFAFRRLFQQFLVDLWAQIDQWRLLWYKRNQKMVRSGHFSHLQDTFAADDNVDPANIGKRSHLPSSHVGSPRFIKQCYQDSMAIVRHLGPPALFITFTANPKWPEITRELYPGMTAADRPDLIARVFNLRVRDLLADLKYRSIFGRQTGIVYTIEYQKRGLPHAHILLFLDREDRNRFKDPDYIDHMIWAELPTSEQDPDGELSNIIQTTMIHGPCGDLNPGAQCMRPARVGSDKTCAKGFPKPFAPETTAERDGYPIYRRRNDGRTWLIRGKEVDNRWVVPYSPYLCRKHNAHINVEVCLSVRAVKYIHKYIYKGTDQITVQIDDPDELTSYLNRRYIGPTEAAWMIFGFPVHAESPSVIRLPVHLDGQQSVCFGEEEAAEDILERVALKQTELMGWFEYNTLHEDGRTTLYPDFPQKYVWKKKKQIWEPRKRKEDAIGRCWWVGPRDVERHWLRQILHNVPGKKSFEDVRTVDGVVYDTFHQAAGALGLLEDDEAWYAIFNELRVEKSGHVLRYTFVDALTFGDLANPGALWDKFADDICDDLLFRLAEDGIRLPDIAREPHHDYGLWLINQLLHSTHNTALDRFPGMPLPYHSWGNQQSDRLIAEQLDYDPDLQFEEFSRLYPGLNNGQKEAFDTIMASLGVTSDGSPDMPPPPPRFFLQGSGGTGKTHLYRIICNKLRSLGKIVLCVASSGIAALLLPGGRTAHSRFKIPLDINEDSTCNISADSDEARLLRQAALIIWDEVPMQHRFCFEAVDRTLQDITKSSELFGGIPILFGGDFQQILPVIRKGNRSSTVGACIQRSYIWPMLYVLKLTENMRLARDEANRIYGEWLLSVASDPGDNRRIAIPDGVRQYTGLTQFCSHIYPADQLRVHNNAPADNAYFFQNRCILSVRNDAVAEINDFMLGQFQGEKRVYLSADTAELDGVSEVFQPATETLQSFNPASLPPSKLCLKIGVPVILLRNLNPKQGLCNGTRLLVVELGQRSSWIRGRILGGDFDGQERIIPRIKLTAEENDLLPYPVSRRQIPVRLCFAMSINKSQGQSMKFVGVDLRHPVFTHGQLYVALSRVTTRTGISILTADDAGGSAVNIVYNEVLLP